jgi:orotidine-5'-phosphate decarboxylase
MTTSSPVFCAIDRPDLDGALALCRSLAGAVGGLKLGLEFVGANGPEGVRRVSELGLPIFLDLKLHDIPNTVAGAVRAASGLGIAMLTVHAAGGAAMLRAARDAARESARPPAILGVTVLTSLGDDDLRATGVRDGAEDQVLRLASLALEAGCDGLVCSPREIAPLRARFGPEALLVVPGIRLGPEVQDQRRTLGPGEAIALGASRLVIGRPITAAADPRAAALAIDALIRRARAA